MSKNVTNEQAYTRWEQFQNNILDEIKSVEQLNNICRQLESDNISKLDQGFGESPSSQHQGQINQNFESDLRNDRPAIVRKEFVPQ